MFSQLISGSKWPGALSLWVYVVFNRHHDLRYLLKIMLFAFDEFMSSSCFFEYLDIRTRFLLCCFIWKISIMRIKSIAVFKRVLLFTGNFYYFFPSYLMKCFSILSYTIGMSSVKLIYWWAFVKWTWWLEIILIYLEK